MSQLHEVLAVEGDLEAVMKKTLKEASDTFKNKQDHFMGFKKSLSMFDDAREGENTTEVKELVTTVLDKLDYALGHVAKYWDAFAQKEFTNQEAKADLVVAGAVIAKDVPATYLLGMESKLKALRAMLEGVPTLQPGRSWEKADDMGAGVWRDKEVEERQRTEKVIQHKVLYDATEHHPAQIETWSQDVPVGKIAVSVWSGNLSPSQKSKLLGRLDDLLRGVKKARQRANTAKVVKADNLSRDLLSYLTQDIR